jgi:hypothetical protein
MDSWILLRRAAARGSMESDFCSTSSAPESNRSSCRESENERGFLYCGLHAADAMHPARSKAIGM